MRKWGLLAFAVACGLTVSVPLASADTTSPVGDTTTVTCTFDPSVAPGVTTCSQRTDEVTGSGNLCEPAGPDGTPVLVFFHNDYFSSRVYRGNAVVHGLNGVPVTADVGPTPVVQPDTSWAAYDDAIYALVARPHAHLESSTGISTDRDGSWPVYVPVDSCG